MEWKIFHETNLSFYEVVVSEIIIDVHNSNITINI